MKQPPLYKITNSRTQKTIASRASMARGFFSRMKGLLGRASLPEGEALIIPCCDGIHTFFMRFPIDVIFLDRGDKIVKIARSLPPFKESHLFFKSVKIVELPAGRIDPTGSLVGDTLIFKEEPCGQAA